MNQPPAAGKFPLALPAPDGDVVEIGTPLVLQAIEASRQSPRGRIILPLQASAADRLHRMLNAMQPGSYVRPHRHLDPPKAESVVVLRGSIGYVAFDDTGSIRGRWTVAAGSDVFGLDTRPGVYHTFYAREPDTVLFEVKPGPYDAATDKDFAPWAPAEGDPSAAAYLRDLGG